MGAGCSRPRDDSEAQATRDAPLAQGIVGEREDNRSRTQRQQGNSNAANQPGNAPVTNDQIPGEGEAAAAEAGEVGKDGSHSAPTSETLRCLVNIKKPTLRVVPNTEEGATGTYGVMFTADCTAPCLVSVFFKGYQKDSSGQKSGSGGGHSHSGPPRLKSVQTKRVPSAMAQLEGMDQHFDSLTCATQSKNRGLPLDELQEEELTPQRCKETNIYPIVIRLQTVHPRPVVKDDASDNEHEAEANGDDKQQQEMPHPQAQTTFATVRKQGDGCYEVQVLKQTLWMNGASFVLQEIYGVEKKSEDEDHHHNHHSHDGYDEDSEEEVDEGEECVVCLTQPRDTLALPCRHLCLCRDCATVVRNQTNKCPICRGVVTTLLQVRFGQGQHRGHGEEHPLHEHEHEHEGGEGGGEGSTPPVGVLGSSNTEAKVLPSQSDSLPPGHLS